MYNATSVVTACVVSDTNHPVGPHIFRHVLHPEFNQISDIVSIGLLID